MNTVVILRGLPGSGKTTFAELLRWSRRNAVICSADRYFTSPDGTYKFDGSKLSEAHAQCMRDFDQAIRLKAELIIVDNTNANEHDMAYYWQLAASNGYMVHVVVMENREGNKSKHNVPSGTIAAMAKRLYESIVL